jgi:hypothetical protein
MNRKPIWIEQQHFQGFGCSECTWTFNSSSPPTGNSLDEMMRDSELQRDKEFRLHICSDHPGTRSSAQCQEWEKRYRAAVLEGDRIKLPRRIEQAEAAILERSRSLSRSSSNDRKEQDAIMRALHILSLLRQAGHDRQFHPEPG